MRGLLRRDGEDVARPIVLRPEVTHPGHHRSGPRRRRPHEELGDPDRPGPDDRLGRRLGDRERGRRQEKERCAGPEQHEEAAGVVVMRRVVPCRGGRSYRQRNGSGSSVTSLTGRRIGPKVRFAVRIGIGGLRRRAPRRGACRPPPSPDARARRARTASTGPRPLERAVLGVGALDEPLAHPPDALMVARADRPRGAGRGSPRAASPPSPRRGARRRRRASRGGPRARPPPGGAGRGRRRGGRSAAGSRGRSRASAGRARAPPRAARSSPASRCACAGSVAGCRSAP